MKQMERLIETWESDVGVVLTPQHEVERAADVGEGSGEADLLDAENTEDNKSSEVRTESELPDGDVTETSDVEDVVTILAE